MRRTENRFSIVVSMGRRAGGKTAHWSRSIFRRFGSLAYCSWVGHCCVSEERKIIDVLLGEKCVDDIVELHIANAAYGIEGLGMTLPDMCGDRPRPCRNPRSINGGGSRGEIGGRGQTVAHLRCVKLEKTKSGTVVSTKNKGTLQLICSILFLCIVKYLLLGNDSVKPR